MTAVRAAIEFGLHRLFFAMRDRRYPPLDLVQAAGIVPGNRVVDFGCGSGSHVVPAAMLTGPKGHVYAVDANPHAIRHVKRLVVDRGLTNVTVAQTERAVPLPPQTVDVVLLNDVLHALRDPQPVLCELQRVLKPEGHLVVSDHHLSRERLERMLGAQSLFRFVTTEGTLHRFARRRSPGEADGPDHEQEQGNGRG